MRKGNRYLVGGSAAAFALTLALCVSGASSLYAGQIVFVSERDGNQEIYTMDDDGDNQENRTNNSAADRHPRFCPDGRIVFASDRDGDWEVYIMDNDGTDLEPLTDNTDNDGYPDCSDEGIVFVSDRDGGVEVCTMDTDGSNQDCDLISGYGDQPSWLHEAGTEILYVTSGTSVFDIWKMDADGSDEEGILETSNEDVFPDGSPDGLAVAFTRLNSSFAEGEVYTMRPNGTQVTQITDDLNSGDSHTGAWDPSSNHIVFSNDGDGDWEINIMDSDGDHVTQLTDNSADDWDPDWR